MSIFQDKTLRIANGTVIEERLRGKIKVAVFFDHLNVSESSGTIRKTNLCSGCVNRNPLYLLSTPAPAGLGQRIL